VSNEKTLQLVHFHEVGAIDSIVDTVGVVLALHLLGVEEVYCSALPMGNGTVWAAHGLMPVPAPATLNLMQDMVLCPGPGTRTGTPTTGELVTPTGASLIRALCGLPSLYHTGEDGVSPPSSGSKATLQGVLPPYGFKLERVGTGAGSKDFPKHPNIVRVMVGTLNEHSGGVRATDRMIEPNTNNKNGSHDTGSQLLKKSTPKHEDFSKDITYPNDCSRASISASETSLWEEETLFMFQANVDDATAEALAYTADCVRDVSGVLDVWTEAIGMKKGRAAQMLNVLSQSDKSTKVCVYVCVYFYLCVCDVFDGSNVA
jgi:uncharacterized protein (DUF111 family)